MEGEEHLEIGVKSAANVLQNVIGAVLGLVALFFIARWLNKTIYGEYAFVLSLYNIFSIFTNLGLTNAYMKRYHEKGINRDELWGTFIALKVLFTIIAVGFVFSFVFYFGPTFFHIRLYDATTPQLMVLMLLWMLIEGCVLSPFRAQITTEVAFVSRSYLMVLETIVRVVMFILTAYLFLIHSISAQIAAIMLLFSFIGGKLTSGIGSMIFSGRSLPKFKINKSLAKSMIKFAIPLAIAGPIAALSTNIDKVMIGWFLTSAQVGGYSAVQKYARVITNFAMALQGLFFVKIAQHHGRNNKEEIRDIVNYWTVFLSVFLAPIPWIYFGFSDNVIRVFLSNQYLTAKYVLILLAFTSTIAAMRIAVSAVFPGVNKPSISAKITGIVSAVNIALNAVLIPRMGSTGAALATLLSAGILGSFLSYSALRKYIPEAFKIFGKSTLLLLSGFISFVPAYFLDKFADRFYVLIPAMILSYFIYIGIAYLLRLIRREDLAFVLSILNPKNLIKFYRIERNNR